MEYQPQPEIVEDQALKKMLRPQDYQRDVAIPRAQVKRFPSNVSKFRRSQSARYLSRAPSKTIPIDIATLGVGPPPITKTIPIDIATLGVAPSPKMLVTRELGRSYSNRSDNIKDFRRPLRQNSGMQRPVGGGSFLYSGNYDPNHQNGRIITKPVPLARSQSLNHKSGQPPPQKKRTSPPSQPQQNLRNPMAAGRAMIISEDEEEDDEDVFMSQDNQFDNWANNLYDKDINNNRNDVIMGAAPQQLPPKNKKGQQLSTMFTNVAQEEATHSAIGFFAEGDPALGDGLITGMGGKMGGAAGNKMGGMIGKKLGNEEMGQELGDAVGDELGQMATDAGKDALTDLVTGEELSPPEVPDASNLCSKCVIT